TKKTDKFPALAGVTMFFRDHTKYTPVAGLWKEILWLDLLWTSNIQSFPRPARLPGIPTWSWVSIDGPVKGPLLMSRGMMSSQSTSRTRFDVLELRWTGQPLVSSLNGGKLMVQGYTKQILAAYDSKLSNERRDIRGNVFSYPVNPAEREGPNIGIGRCTFDEAPPPPTQPVWCIEIGASEDGWWGLQNHLSSWNYHILLLEPTGRVDEYRRIGIGYIREPKGIDEVPTPEPPDNFKG